jgi:hypothetical protein
MENDNVNQAPPPDLFDKLNTLADQVKTSDNIFNRRPQQRGLSDFLRNIQIGEVVQLGNFKQTSIYPTARNLGMKFQTKTHNGIVYVKRVE